MSDRNVTNAGVRLAVSPLSWVNEVLDDLGRDTTADTILTEARAAGFQGVETSRAFPSQPQALADRLKAHDLRLASGWYSGFLAERDDIAQDMEDVRAHASLLRACGADVMVYGECGHMVPNALDVALSERLTLAGDDMAAYGDRLTRFAAAIYDEFGLGLAYHHHLMMVAETLDEVRAVMSNSGSELGLLLDTGHAFAGGFDYATLITEFGPRINHIHLKDVRGPVLERVRAEGVSFNDAVRAGMFTVPGDGDVDFTALARFIGETGYSGWLVVEAEQDPAKAPPAETVTRARRFVTDNILMPALI